MLLDDGPLAAAAFGGHLQEARQLVQQAEAVAARTGYSGRLYTVRLHLAAAEALYGNRQRAVELVTATLRHTRAPIDLDEAAFALALAGEADRGESLRKQRLDRAPRLGKTRASFTATGALIDIQRGDIDRAMEALRAEIPTDLGFLPRFRTIYVRGLAYLARHDTTAAVAEFQILDHRGVEPLSPLYPLAHLQQGRAFALAGDLSRASAAYERFFQWWKDADGDVPVLQEARRELESTGAVSSSSRRR
jgi:tetratricopeptide (TPR) repeat protein